MNRSYFRRIGMVLSFVMTALLGVSGAQAAPSQKAVEMLGNVRPAVSAELPEHAKASSGVSGVMNSRAVEASAIGLTLADGRKVTAQLQRVAQDDLRNTRSWIGSFSDEPGSMLILTRVSGTVSGFATYGKETFEIRPSKGGRHLLYAVDTARLPDLEPAGGNRVHSAGDTLGTTSAYGAGDTTLAAGTGVVQDLLVVYTAASANAWGVAELEGMIQSSVQYANQAYLNSQVGINLNVVGMQQVSVTEAGGMVATLDAVRQSSEVRSLRDKLAADMVVLVSQDSDYCGYAYLAIFSTVDAYSVVNSRCLGGYTLAHEVGHLQELDHDRTNSVGAGLYPYSYGYRECVSGGFIDIMSYPCGGVARIPNFSNPNIWYNGYATGISYESNPSQAADSARSLNETANSVAAYRVGTTTTTTVPASPSGLAASSVAYNGVTLVWSDNATNESGYKVERSPDGVVFAEVANLGKDARSFADSGVSVSSNYFYRVRAFNSVGFSGYSNTVTVTTPAAPPPPPPAPTSVNASDRADGSALVAWVSDSMAATSYEVRRETWDARKQVWGRSTVAATVSGNVRSVIDSTNNGTFRYFVRGLNSGGASSYAGPAQVTVSGGIKGGRARK